MTDDDHSNVGYKKPPTNTRFKKGQSGNPKGRPKKVTNMKLLIESELDRKISIKDNGEIVHTTKREALVK